MTHYRYDANRNLIEQTDARGNTVETRYDSLGRPIATIQPGGITTERTYDENGNLLVVTDPKGQTVTNTYDEWNRLKTKVYAFAPGDPYRPSRWLSSVVYGYDANSNVTRIEETVASGTDPPPSSPNQITTRTYDDFDRVLSETVTLPEGGTKTVSYTYFKNGNRKTLTDADGVLTGYTYDGQNRLETVTTPEGVTTYTYWPDDLLKTVTVPSGLVSSYDYDWADRLTLLVTRHGATVVSQYVYTYDANGNRTSQTETNGGAPETTTYTYDRRDRLTSVTYPPDEIFENGRIVAYTYDQVGNRLTERTIDPFSGETIASKAGTFDALNRLTVLADQLNAAQTVTFSYDANGNQIAKTVAGATTAFRYDVRDRLVEVETPAAIATRFEYDADGRMTKKIGEDGIRQYVYDEDARSLELDHAGVSVARYSYGADRLLSLIRADEGLRFYHLDGLGSVTVLTDASGAVVSHLKLDAWGLFRNPNAPDGPFASKNRFAFTGYVFDRETELYFAKARFYDPTVGRFTSQDSFLGEIDTPPSLHRYFYGYANPLRYVDPTGHASFDVQALHDKHLYEEAQGYDAEKNVVRLERADRQGWPTIIEKAPSAALLNLFEEYGSAEAAISRLRELEAKAFKKYAVTITEPSDYVKGHLNEDKLYKQFLEQVGGFAGDVSGLREDFLGSIRGAQAGESRDVSKSFNLGYDYSAARAYQVAEESATRMPLARGWQINGTLIGLGREGLAPKGFATEYSAWLALDAASSAAGGVGIYRGGAALLRGGAQATASAGAAGRVTVYRVEGAVNQRLVIGSNGEVGIIGDNTLFLNFGSRARAEEFLSKRLAQGMADARIKTFEVPKSLVDDLRASSVRESLSSKFPDRPLRVDVTKAPDQFGLRAQQIEELKKAAIAGTGKTH